MKNKLKFKFKTLLIFLMWSNKTIETKVFINIMKMILKYMISRGMNKIKCIYVNKGIA